MDGTESLIQSVCILNSLNIFIDNRIDNLKDVLVYPIGLDEDAKVCRYGSGSGELETGFPHAELTADRDQIYKPSGLQRVP